MKLQLLNFTPLDNKNLMGFTIGRVEEQKKLIKNVSSGIPTLVLGKPGVGKTHLLFLLRKHLS